MPIKRKYLDILRLEIEDLIEDIGVVVNEYKRRRDLGEITNYVFLENLAVLHNELLGVDDMMEMLDNVNPDGAILQGCYLRSRGGEINCDLCGFTPNTEATLAYRGRPGSLVAGYRIFIAPLKKSRQSAINKIDQP